jgi:hypothetical protein
MPGDRDSVRLVIELSNAGDPIEGTLIEPSSHAGRFRGWLALTALIESTRRRDERQGDTGPP